MHVSMTKLRKALLAAAAAFALLLGVTPAPASAGITAYDGGTSCVSYSYGRICSGLRQYSGDAPEWPWGEFYQAAGTASPDMIYMSMSVELCKGSTRSTTCNRPSNASTPQSWSILSDYNNECSYIYRGGPSDSGACDMSGLAYSGTVGTYYYSKTTISFRVRSGDVLRTMTALSPVQLHRS